MAENETKRCTISVSQNVLDHLHKVKDKLAKSTAVQCSMTQVLEYLIAVEAKEIKSLD